MKITNFERNSIEMIKTVYDSYIDFSDYDTNRVDSYHQDMFKDSYSKQKDKVLIYAPKEVSIKCTIVKINNDNTISFWGNNELLLRTYSQCVEDMVGLNNVKGFVLD